jgi:hypothetical protein
MYAMDDSSATTERPSLVSPDSTAEAEALAEYRSPSVLALIALVLGLASPLVFVAQILLAVPLFGIGVSLVALAKIAASKGQLSGRWAALVGLSLSVACLSAAESRIWMAEWRMAGQARPVAQEWLAHLLQGEGEAAFQMTAAAQRAAMDAAEAEPPMLGSGQTPLEEFLGHPVVKALLEMGPQAQVQLVGTQNVMRTTPYQAIVEQHFRVQPVERGTPWTVAITLEQRGLVEDGEAPVWRVANFEQVRSER